METGWVARARTCSQHTTVNVVLVTQLCPILNPLPIILGKIKQTTQRENFRENFPSQSSIFSYMIYYYKNGAIWTKCVSQSRTMTRHLTTTRTNLFPFLLGCIPMEKKIKKINVEKSVQSKSHSGRRKCTRRKLSIERGHGTCPPRFQLQRFYALELERSRSRPDPSPWTCFRCLHLCSR